MSRADPYKTTTVLPPILPKQNNLLLDTKRDSQAQEQHRYANSEHLVQQSIKDLPVVISKLAQCEIQGCTFTNQHSLSEIARNAIRAINKHHAIREARGDREQADAALQRLNEDLGSNIATMVYQEVRRLRAADVREQAVNLEDELTQERLRRQQLQMHNKVLNNLNELEELFVDRTASNTNIHANERVKLRGQYVVGQTGSASIQPGSLHEDNKLLDSQLQHKYNTETNLLLPFDHMGSIESPNEFKQRINATLQQHNSTPTQQRPLSADPAYRVTPSYTRFDETIYSLNGELLEHQYASQHPLQQQQQQHHHLDYSSMSSAPLAAVKQHDASRQEGLQRYIDAVPHKFSTNSTFSYHDDDNDDDDDWMSDEEDDEEDSEIDAHTYNTIADYHDQVSAFSDWSFSR